ncbi:NAD-glutamate dehydrogenase [Thalassotalea ponticola]|uniref:NAD-glutamate dehydrogenase n=1 Tax=Thalassotalea ponticola TaxID=1523392 RepID=UPI0025B2A72C|nr:NAD-glutamate dehydrogenase [Thalassotalea ponticola]MDN3651382.1 NAD-glutamate dehydrogenase [Thalassotalea ponticola]
MASFDNHSSVLFSNVTKLIREKVPAETAPLLEQFTSLFYHNLSADDLAGRNESDVYGATLSLWKALNSRENDNAFIRVLNPEVSKHGWKSSHTVIEIILKDTPFLVDSTRIALNRLGLSPHLIVNCPMKIVRDYNNQVSALGDATKELKESTTETVFFIEIDRLTTQKQIDQLTQELDSVYKDVWSTVNDWQALTDKFKGAIAHLETSKAQFDQDDYRESKEFLEWLLDNNFTFMGYRYYEVKKVKGDVALQADRQSGLGLMRDSDEKTATRMVNSLPEKAREIALGNNILILTKTNSKSRVHRPAHMDYIGIKRFDEQGHVIAEERFLGLFGSAFYNDSALNLPIIRHKVQRVCQASGFAPNSHAYKTLINILETYPRDEILQSSIDELVKTVKGVLQMQERDVSGLFVRRDVFDRFYSCMVYVPRERYNTQLRIDTQKILQAAFGSEHEVEFNTFFSESVQARTHYIVRVDSTKADINVKEIERNLNEAARSWDDKFFDALKANKGEVRGKALARKYASFAQSYKDEVLPGTAIVDIDKLEAISDNNPLEMLFYQPLEEKADSRFVKLKLFHKGEPLHLSDVLPMLENFGLRVIGESPYMVRSDDGEMYWILDFSMLLTGHKTFNLEQVQALFQDAFAKVWHGELEDDGFNKLILGAGLAGREVSILRAYAKYQQQIGSTFSQSYIESTFTRYPNFAELLVQLFNLKFDPKGKSTQKAITKVVETIETSLDAVASLDDDRIIRRYVEIMNATMRTNYYQKDEQGVDKSYMSFKLMPELIPEMPKPLPKYEIFVYSPQVEGVHLRGGKVARGGLRWSDRREDFRTEVLGLVKAQQVKNTVIVPVGAKGGFYCKQLPLGGTRQEIFEAGRECYKTFIRALLDITDNIVGGEVVHPDSVIRLDEDDTYLVVAADKGTATFSDTANEIAEEYGFWLGDAFASGGSVGYDHKKMGITAKGAWESVKRHFREIGVNCQTTDFTVLAVGDMGGDVFGNGMLLSKHICLQVAFNHMHIFIDPTPDSASSYVERERLFNLPGSSWDDYNRDLISEGGGIFSRAEKSIKLTPQMKQMLGTKKLSLSPNELIQHALKMKVDLIWNGGIGTYIKGSKESHAEVGDRANDVLRVNGSEVQAKVIGEGGNLGCTQLGRIEYTSNGGRMNTDFVDNVGGVDCSDNEVNIKILLNTLVANGDLTIKQRNNLLYDMTDDVERIVLEDCYHQTHSISISEARGAKKLKEQQRFIHHLERHGKLDRALEFIPSDEEMVERMARGRGLTRPEISVLIAYGKMVLKEELLVDEINDDPYLNKLLITAFPEQLQKLYKQQMQLHPLRGEIIATRLANDLCNYMGSNFVVRMQEETGADSAEVAKCFTIASAIFELEQTWSQITELDNKIEASVQTEMLFELRRNVRRATRWLLRHRNKAMTIEQSIDFFAPSFAVLSANLDKFIDAKEAKGLNDTKEQLKERKVPAKIAQRIAQLSTLFSTMDIAQIATQQERDVPLVAALYYTIGVRLELHWFLDQITKQPVDNHWQALARASFREELDWQQRELTSAILRQHPDSKDIDAMIDDWVARCEQPLTRWRQVLADFKTSKTHEFAKFSVALRELMMLSHHNDHASS